MVKIAVVEDEDNAFKLLEDSLLIYQKEHKENFYINRFKNAIDFLTNYKKAFDIVFIDIMLPNLNGMEAALKLRNYDKFIIIIFVTNMVQFAVKGYEVDALDYILKPINYPKLSFKLQKAISIVNSNQQTEITISQTDGYVRLSTTDLLYIEVSSHKLVYHSINEKVSGYGSLTDLEKN